MAGERRAKRREETQVRLRPKDDSTVYVVGAGPAGLVTAAMLARHDIPAVVLEQSDGIAGAWRARYDRLHLNTSRLTSGLPGMRFRRGAGLFPSRDEFVAYLEEFARRNAVTVRFGTRVEALERSDGRWLLRTSRGPLSAAEVVVATGYARQPIVPGWPGRNRFGGRMLHSAGYVTSRPFRGRDVLVVGAGSSGLEIAYDLAEGGAARVRVSARTPPNIVLRRLGRLPGDLFALPMLKLPARIADGQHRLMRRLVLGDLSAHGLPQPDEGPFGRLERLGVAPAIVDREVVDAIASGRIEVVAGVAALDETGATLANGGRAEVDTLIAATGYACGLEPMVGHLGILDAGGVPATAGGDEAAPGLRFVGFVPRPPQMWVMAREAKRAAAAIARARSARPRTASAGRLARSASVTRAR
jgi:cation diffusion facilitator CzcD-associated flavoprotein CzcO